MILRAMQQILQEILTFPIGALREETALATLYLDTLDQIELLLRLEERFDIQISDAEAENFVSLGDLINHIELKLCQKAV